MRNVSDEERTAGEREERRTLTASPAERAPAFLPRLPQGAAPGPALRFARAGDGFVLSCLPAPPAPGARRVEVP